MAGERKTWQMRVEGLLSSYGMDWKIPFKSTANVTYDTNYLNVGNHSPASGNLRRPLCLSLWYTHHKLQKDSVHCEKCILKKCSDLHILPKPHFTYKRIQKIYWMFKLRKSIILRKKIRAFWIWWQLQVSKTIVTGPFLSQCSIASSFNISL